MRAAYGEVAVMNDGSIRIRPQSGEEINLQGPVVMQDGPWIDVRGYGAQGDGTTDDTASIAAALSRAAALGGATVFVSPGTYKISSTLTLSPGVALRGASSLSSVLKLADGANCDIITRGSGHGQFRYISDLYLDGNKANNISGRGIYLATGAVSSYIRNVNLINVAGIPLYLDTCDQMLVENIYVNSTDAVYGVYLKTCTQMTLLHLASERSATASFYLEQSDYCNLYNVGSEQTAGSGKHGLVLDSCIGVNVFGAMGFAQGSQADAVRITNDASSSRTSDITLVGLLNAGFATNTLNDTTSNGLVLAAATPRLGIYFSPGGQGIRVGKMRIFPGVIRGDGGNGFLIQNAAGSSTWLQANETGLGFYGATPIAKPAITGSRGANDALASLLTALANLGLVTDSSS